MFIASEPAEDSDKAYAAIHSPLANLGRYFSFCSGVPYHTRGKVPIVTWALNVTEKLPEVMRFCETRLEVILSISRPPYCSGTSIPSSPKAPRSRISLRLTSQFLDRKSVV